MITVSRITLAVAALALAGQATAQITFFENDDFQGQSFTTDRPVNNLDRYGFNDRASSVVVRGNRGERWEVCEDSRFRGRCVVLRPGEYPSLDAMGLNGRISSVRAVASNARVDERRYAPVAAPVPQPVPVEVSQVVFYENEGFTGRTFTADAGVADFRRFGFNDLASSAVVRGERWEACEDINYGGRCIVLRPGQYASLASMGMNDRISSVRTVSSNAPVEDARYSPQPALNQDYARRHNERTYEANITSVRAVVEDSGQRCWVERQQVVQDRGGPNVGGAVLGAVIGGILGHQVGGGSGKDVATGLGVVTGAAIGGNSGRNEGGQATTQNVQRCSNTPAQAHPAYWDVTYNFRGVEHRMQMTTQPGNTVLVNEQGEPRA